MKVYIDLDESWIFSPMYDGCPLSQISDYVREKIAREIASGKVIDMDPELLDRYQKVAREFFDLNAQMEDLYRAHFMRKQDETNDH